MSNIWYVLSNVFYSHSNAETIYRLSSWTVYINTELGCYTGNDHTCINGHYVYLRFPDVEFQTRALSDAREVEHK